MSVPSEIAQIIATSGNSFHARVARWLADNGWTIRVSPYFMDQSQNKAREIDLVAERFLEIRDAFGGWSGDVVIRLFVECKFVPGHSVFWFTDKDMDAAMRLVVKQGGGFRQDNSYTKNHHYLSKSPKVAKVFASSKSQEQDPFYKALNQVLNAQVSLRKQAVFVLPESRPRKQVAILNCPVIVCSSFANMFATDFLVDSPPTVMGENFQLEVQYAYTEADGTSRNEHFLIDVVEFDQLPSLSDLMTADAELACFMLQRN